MRLAKQKKRKVASLAGDIGAERHGTSWRTASPWISLEFRGYGGATLGPALCVNCSCLNLIHSPGEIIEGS